MNTFLVIIFYYLLVGLVLVFCNMLRWYTLTSSFNSSLTIPNRFGAETWLKLLGYLSFFIVAWPAGLFFMISDNK